MPTLTPRQRTVAQAVIASGGSATEGTLVALTDLRTVNTMVTLGLLLRAWVPAPSLTSAHQTIAVYGLTALGLARIAQELALPPAIVKLVHALEVKPSALTVKAEAKRQIAAAAGEFREQLSAAATL